MSESQWLMKGATLSHNYAHGNPYFRLLRVEVESLAQELHGTNGVEKQEVKHKLQKITKEITSLKRRLASSDNPFSVLHGGGANRGVPPGLSTEPGLRSLSHSSIVPLVGELLFQFAPKISSRPSLPVSTNAILCEPVVATTCLRHPFPLPGLRYTHTS